MSPKSNGFGDCHYNTQKTCKIGLEYENTCDDFIFWSELNIIFVVHLLLY